MGTMGPMSGQAITLANSIIGVGILAMPFCFKQCGIILSMLILIGSGFVSRLACHFLLKSAFVTRRKNFEALAYQVFGSAGKLSVEIGIIGYLMGTCVAYFVVVGDLGPQIIAKMLNFNQSDTLRTSVMVIVSLVCVLPLGLLRNVDSLSNVCAATIGFYFCLVLKVILEATGPLFSGEWLDKVTYWEAEGVLQCLPIFSMSLFCQTQLFGIYDTLPNATLEKMNHVTKNAVNICSVMYVLTGLFGYIAFCNQPISGNILLSFSPTLASDAIKMGFVMSLAFSFPLIIFPCRASLYSLLFRKGQASHHELLNNVMPEMRFKCLTIGIISVSLFIGLMLPNIELVLGLVGSTIGVMISVIFPATCFICMSTKNTNERLLAQLVLCFGIIIMVLGTYANLQAAEIDNISLENKIMAEQVHAKITENKFLQALSPHGNENNLDDGKLNIISSNEYDVNKNVFETNIIAAEKSFDKKDLSSEGPLKENSIILPPNPVPPKDERVETIKHSIKANDNDKPLSKVQSEPSNKDEREGAGDKEMQTESNITPSPIHKLTYIKPSQETLQVQNLEKSTQSENDNFKQDELMNTIKRHEEEQRKMVIEQQKILEEIREARKDMEIKQKADTSLSMETKKLAVENIQKIAKMAIESLGGQMEETTLHSKINQQVKQSLSKVPSKIDIKMPQIQDNNENKKPTVEDKKISKTITVNDVKFSTNSHIHKKDEPESYKNGEDAENIKKMKALSDKNNNSTHITKEGANIVNRPPIAIAMSKGNEDKTIGIKNDKQAMKIPNTDKTDLKKDDFKKITEKADIPQEDYIGGKRDILEVHTQKTAVNNAFTENSKTAKVYSRNKRDILDCPGKIVSNNRGIQICQIDEGNDETSDNLHTKRDVLKFSDPINNIDPNKYISSIMNSGGIVDFHLRNLKSFDMTNGTSPA